MSAPPGFGLAKDRVAILCDMRNAAYDQRDTTLLELVDYIRCFLFPEIDSNPSNNIAGYEGDPAYTRTPFLVSKSEAKAPLLMNVIAQIVAIKDGRTDFILESKVFDTSAIRRLDSGQDVDIDDSKGYIVGSPMNVFNDAALIRDISFDTTTHVGYTLTYGFILRYEYWLQALLLSESANVDVSRDIENLTQEWNNYTVNGWSLRLRLKWEVKNTITGFVTPFQSQTTITQRALGAEPDSGPIVTKQTKYYILDDSDNFVEVNGIQEKDRTLVRFICDGDFTTAPTGTSGFGYIFADLEGSGGSTNRRFASTEYASESDTPWAVTEDNEFGDNPDTTYTNGPCRRNDYGTTRVIIESWYDDRINKWSDQRPGSILIYPRLGFWNQIQLREFADGENHLWSGGEHALFP